MKRLLVLAVLFLVSFATVWFFFSSSKEALISDVPRPAKGVDTARVVIDEFTDFQCSYCAKCAYLLAKLLKEYPRDLQVRFHDFPLPQHIHAKKAAMAARLAEEQGMFWQYYEALFARQNHWNHLTGDDFQRYLVELAEIINIPDLKLFEERLESQETAGIVEKDFEEGLKLQVRRTPTLFINGQRKTGFIPYDKLKNLIEKELQKSKMPS